MKQKGYTLAEILIAGGIIGVLAAVTLPMVNKFKPDTRKVLYLNTYDALALSISDMANNHSYYPVTDGEYTYSKYPFANLTPYIDNTNAQHRIAGGGNKFCRVISENFHILEAPDELNCSDTYTAYNGNNFITSFTSKNGVEFMISTYQENIPSDANNRYRTDITIDVNGSAEGPNCVFDRDNPNRCAKPDRFTFKVSADAEFLPTDEMGIRYLETRTSLKFKKENFDDYNNNNSQLVTDIKDRFDQNNEDFQQFALEKYIDNGNGNGNDNDNEGGDGDDERNDDHTPKPILPDDPLPIGDCDHKSAGYDNKGNEMHYACN